MQSVDSVRGLGLGIYAFLAKRQPKSYLGKIMLVAFLGTHIPLLTLFFYAITTANLPHTEKVQVLLVALIATLIGTAITLYTLRMLLMPITATFMGLRQYLAQNVKPQLPTHFTDAAGTLMADTMYTIAKLDETIQHLKHYDTLTALPNRTLFQYQLAEKLRQRSLQDGQEQKALAVLMIDLDNFSNFNNNLGQSTGDLLLRQVAQRLAALEEDEHLVARMGGDEFALLCEGYLSINDVISQSKRVLTTLNRPFRFDEQEYYLTVSIGIATWADREERATGLLANADTALRVAKQQGRNGVQFFLTEMNQALQQRLQLECDIRRALEREEFVLYYQPQIDLNTGEFRGAEALLRWQHPERGFVSPADIIPVAEESGLILPLGEWVLQEACRQAVAWQAAGLPPIRIAVNLSAAQFQTADLVQLVAKTLATSNLDPRYLELEITESLLMEDVEKAIAVLQQLRAIGTSIALDDFGTGYSSLSYLKRFPLQYLKIDRSFVSGIPEDSNDQAIVHAIVALAQSLQLAVIAEGVETEAQARYLQQIGCAMFQGYYSSRPVPAAEFVRLWQETGQQRAMLSWCNLGSSCHRTFRYRQRHAHEPAYSRTHPSSERIK
ncbi:MAG: EAL domain-containing protein [Caldilineaceae bacterium]|nr:EAL domain-containing protein [Caldilineaceae bacterium]